MNRTVKNILLLLAVVAWIPRTEMSAGEVHNSLSFEDRVALQWAIEEVYWKYTLWPAENIETKPALRSIVKDSAIRGKTKEYLMKSAALDSYWRRPITAKQMQAEMYRMAKHSRNPELLSELWAALNNDPYLIAECIVRPILVDRFSNEISDFEKKWTRMKSNIRMPADFLHQNYRLPEMKAGTAIYSPVPSGTWEYLWPSDGIPSKRMNHTAVWTGTHMIIWGGYSPNTPLKSGAKYDPATDSWRATPYNTAPTARYGHTAVWTGARMIVWGGSTFTDPKEPDYPLNTGKWFDPVTDTWTTMSTTGAPSARENHRAVLAGKEMLIWGGSSGTFLNTGGRYRYSTDTWTPISTVRAPQARHTHTAVWTGDEMIVWGGYSASGLLRSGGRYDPSTDSWTDTFIDFLTTPSARYHHTAVWIGKEMIVWGGEANGVKMNTGGRYNPLTNAWYSVSTANAPEARAHHTAVSTGPRMIVWGGWDNDGNSWITGGMYNPATNSWNETATYPAPGGRGKHTVVWTGLEMIVWGGYMFYQDTYFDSGGRYAP
ncbi:hypothetical protein L0222_18955 [bacterium]|nr:hypothetical protein [bacterium]MCI0602616.1 hypothetical protein [bacterium]